MKTLHLAITMAAATTLLAGTYGFAADKTEKTVAFRTAIANLPDRYVTTASKGGLDASGTEITARQTFVLVDLNGGDIADGDAVQIKWTPTGAKPTYWHEGQDKVDRIGGKPDAACTFKLKLKAKANSDAVKAAPPSIVLQTASGKFVSVPKKDAALATTETQDNAVTLEIVEISTPKANP